MTEATSPYIVSARKYRPSTFKSVVGQPTLVSTLKNAIECRRLAQAYLYCGPRGVGKTSCARIFAKTINCLNRNEDGDACGECESCKAIERGNSFDLVELDAASNNSVDDIRSISEQVNVLPQNGRYRIFIIDEVHMLSNSAFNAFLKTLEEPPANVIFILATTEKHKVIPTILSRCQIYDFKRISVNDMVSHLSYVAAQEGIETEKEALGVIARKADGAMRDALSIFDRVASAGGGKVTYSHTIESLNVLDYEYYFKLVDAFKKGDVPEALLIYKDIIDKGFDSQFFINGLASHIRDLMVSFSEDTVKLLETSADLEKRYREQAPSMPLGWYYEALKLLNDCDLNYRSSSNKRLLVELALIRLSRLLNGNKSPFETPEQGRPPLPPVEQIRNVAGAGVNSSVQQEKSASKAGISSANNKNEEAQKEDLNDLKKQTPNPLGQNTSGSLSKESTAGVTGTPASSRKPNSRPQSFRLSDSIGSDNTVANKSLEHRENEFTDEEFHNAWNKFIADNPSMHILINAMRASKPFKGEEKNSYRILVDHPAQVQAFEISMPKLLGFLRDSLNNDMLTLQIGLSEREDLPERLSPREYFRKIVEINPTLGEFIGKIDGEII